MPYVSCGEIFDSNSGTPFAAGEARQYTKKFRVIVSEKQEANTFFVCLHPELPRRYAFYRTQFGDYFDTAALMVRMSAAPENATGKENDWQSWIVTCEYSTSFLPSGGPSKQGQQAGTGDSPLSDLPTLHWENEIIQRPWVTDLDGNPFLTSAGNPYKSVMREFVRPILVFTRNEASFGAGQIDKWGMACNSTPFVGRPRGVCRCDPPVGEKIPYGNDYYFRVTYKIKFGVAFKKPYNLKIRRHAFDDNGNAIRIIEVIQVNYEYLDVTDILDESLMRFENDTDSPNFGQPVPMTVDNRVVSTPQLLDGLGQRLVVDDPDAIQPIFNRFQTGQYEELNDLLVGTLLQPNLVP